MGMNVLSYLRQTLRKRDKPRDASDAADSDWDFGARQTPDMTTHLRATPRRQRSASASGTRPSQPHIGTLSLVSHADTDLSLAAPRDPLSVRPVPHSEKHDPAVAEDGNRSGPGKTLPVISGAKDADGPPATRIPEDDVLVAAGRSAKESRASATKSERLAERQRRVQSVASARLADPASRLPLRHVSSAYMMRDMPLPPTPPPSADSLSPSVSPRSPRSQSPPALGQSNIYPTARQSLLRAKRSLPQLHNVWENFLEETSKDSESSGLPGPYSRNTHSMKQVSVQKGSDLSRPLSQQSWRPQFTHPPLPQHTHTSSSASVLTTSSASSNKHSSSSIPSGQPCSPQSSSSPTSTMQHRGIRTRGHARASHQTSSSTSSFSGSASSMGFFSRDRFSGSSMTTVYDGDNPGVKHELLELFQSGDDPASVELDQRAEYRHPYSQPSHPPASIDSFFSNRSRRPAPLSPSNTPVATLQKGSPDHPPTPPVSRSPSRSTSPVPTRGDGHNNVNLAHPGSNSAAHGRGRPSPVRSPKDLKHELPESHTFPRSSVLRRQADAQRNTTRLRVGNAEAAADTNADTEGEDIDDVLSELEYYYNPSPQRSLFKPALVQSRPSVIVPPLRSSSRQDPIPFRSKSASNLNHVPPERMGSPGADDLKWRHRSYRPDQPSMIADLPPRIGGTLPSSPRPLHPTNIQRARQNEGRMAASRAWQRAQSQPTSPTLPSSPSLVRPLNTNHLAKSMNGRTQAFRGPVTSLKTRPNAVQWGYAV
ncbi:hypothetical protein M0805_003693 [Coniferiporia weirii]|nr:hypothetical protein M0805_003693 [Coniferiporia weirii]